MKIFFDTNVIIAGFASRGYSFDVINDSIYKHQIYYTDYLIKEIQGIRPKKFCLSDNIKHSAIFVIKKYFIKGKTAETVDKACRDSKDNQILADALENDIDIIITGDKDLLELKDYRGVRIISPQDYWELK